MLEQILKLYTMAMAGDVRSPLPHLFGPPGCGKSSTVEQAAEILGVNLHIINVARISPLELEGIQMPVDMDSDPQLRLLHATFWTQLKDGDILLLDEFLRGFPEVYNGLLDILTSRRVGGMQLPKVFIIGASNSTVSYDPALADRLLHLPAPDPRKLKNEYKKQAQHIVEVLGLLPEMAESYEMRNLLDQEVLPMYSVLDSFKGKGIQAGASVTGTSIRNLLGQAQLREVQSGPLADLLRTNNSRALQKHYPQYCLLVDGKTDAQGYKHQVRGIDTSKMTEIQQRNMTLNLQLIQMEELLVQEGTQNNDDDDELFAE